MLTDTLGTTEVGDRSRYAEVKDGVATVRFSLVPLLNGPGDENRANYELASVIIPADQEVAVDDVLAEPRRAIQDYIFDDRL